MTDALADTITVKVPIAFKRRRGRKRIVAPDGAELEPAASAPTGEIDSALVKAIARAYRWQRMLESGEYATLRELAKAERLDAAYVSRMLRLTLLAPDLVQRILEGSRSRIPPLEALRTTLPAEWNAQERWILGLASHRRLRDPSAEAVPESKHIASEVAGCEPVNKASR